MFLSKLFSPKWKSEDPGTRMRGIQRLSKPAVLNRLANYDAEAPVREMARQRLEQLEKGAVKTLLGLRSDSKTPDPYLSAQMDCIASQASIVQLVKEAHKMEVQILAVAKCWDRTVLDDVVKNDKNFSTYAAAMHQKWFLQECEKRGNCDPVELMRWLTAGRRVPPEYADDYARCTRCFRSVTILDTKLEHEKFGSLRSTTISRSYDLANNEDHFYYHVHHGSVNLDHMMRTAKSDRQKRGKPTQGLVVVEHQEWNRWRMKFFPKKTVVHLDLRPSVFESLADMKARANDWFPNHFEPLSWFIHFRDENEKEALQHFLKVKGRVRQP
jgi:hypothetical protein